MNWKITYLDYNGNIVSTMYEGTLYGLANAFLPNSSGSQSILKIEKVENSI